MVPGAVLTGDYGGSPARKYWMYLAISEYFENVRLPHVFAIAKVWGAGVGRAICHLCHARELGELGVGSCKRKGSSLHLTMY